MKKQEDFKTHILCFGNSSPQQSKQTFHKGSSLIGLVSFWSHNLIRRTHFVHLPLQGFKPCPGACATVIRINVLFDCLLLIWLNRWLLLCSYWHLYCFQPNCHVEFGVYMLDKHIYIICHLE